MRLNRREFLISGPAAGAAAAADGPKPRIGLVSSGHRKLLRPLSQEDPLDYEAVRDMVWTAIGYGKTRAGKLEARIPAGCWVVVKPNIVFLPPQGGYRPGDITDLRVTKAVVEYVARHSRAARITVAEGGSYRGARDLGEEAAVRQNGRRVDCAGFDWGVDEYPGFRGTIAGMLEEFRRQFPGKKFDFIDLNYDTARDPSGAPRRIPVPRTARGVGAFGARGDYFVTNTILNCGFLINVPVMKVHSMGLTACLKNYVGTAPREVYAPPGRGFAAGRLHDEHSVDGRTDPFIVDLAAFHPPDYNVLDGIRGLQHTPHNNRKPDQMLRNNMVLAGEDPVALDALAASLMGYNVWDMDFLHLAAKRDLGTMDLRRIEVAGDDAERVRRRWGKPAQWAGRCNREWRVSADPASPVAGWQLYTSPTDTLRFAKCLPEEKSYGAAVTVHSDGAAKAFLWAGLRGRAVVSLNGEQVMDERNDGEYRIGQFRKAVELRSGRNQLVFRVEAGQDPPQLSAKLAGPRNDGDSLEGIRWSA
ncbi:MAG: DUF362 domain-containing protein [Bryobacteraceae bacterium]